MHQLDPSIQQPQQYLRGSLMTGHFGVLLINGEEMVEQFMSSCVTCRKNRMLNYISPVGMSDSRMLPTVHPFSMISIDPITSWPIILPDNSIKKLPILIVLCRQTGFVWHKILYDWTTRSFTLAIMILQYRYGKVQSIVSDQGSNMNPLNLNPGISVDGEEKRLMSIIHRQCPVGAQHENTVESRIRLIKQFALKMIGRVKGERYKPLPITQTDFILALALYEINNIPLFRHEKYLYLTPQAIVNPLFKMSVGKLEEDIVTAQQQPQPQQQNNHNCSWVETK